ncbi:N-formylglutamate deformylase [uncultured Sphingomonas sp.]|uniref:N-formylglutamate deformylase n=1 Tax=uncultured Sphingomonas sp. TaxID=158754 RepID=UPI0035C9E223
MSGFLEIRRGRAPLIVAFPHTGTDMPADVEMRFVSGWLARKDADWWIDDLYRFARELDATCIRTRISRSVIDVNRDPWGRSLYPGQATTELCPTTTFDGEPLYTGDGPDNAEIDRRRATYFDPYHAAIGAELGRLRAVHHRVVLYDAHSIRSRIPRLFDGELPQFSVGTNDRAACSGALADRIGELCGRSGHSHVVDGRFRGGWTTRHYGRPDDGIHAVQMELAQRGYMDEPADPSPDNWPTPIHAAPAIAPVLSDILSTCIAFAKGKE